jgi:FkbM family methyltransferase
MSSSELEALLGQDPSRVRDRAATLFDELVSPGQPLVLFGAGGLGRKTLHGLRKLGRPPVAFTDNNPRLHGTEVDGLPVLSPESAARRLGSTAAVVVTIFVGADDVRQRAAGLGCRTVLPYYPLFWKHPETFLPHYAYDLPQRVIEAGDSIRAAWSLLGDEESRREFLGQLRWRLDPASGPPPPTCRDEIYFPPDLVSLSANEVFVDCGGYDGDTTRSFLARTGNRFEKLLILEPDPANFEKLLAWTRSLPPDVAGRIDARPLALGSRAGTVRFDVQGATSSAVSETGTLEVECGTLNTLLEGTAATFIKMDIEGAELDALEGAAAHVSAHRPLLALSTYHRQDHLWAVPLAVRALSESYEFFLRRHSREILDELVLYAIPGRP